MASARADEILAHLSHGPDVVPSLPEQLVVHCADALPVTGVAIMLMTDAGPAGVVAASDGPAATMEELQFTLGEGPCVDCSQTGRPILQPDLAGTGVSRWPAFTDGALDAGIRAVFAFPLRVGGIRLGVLDLYRDRPGTLTDDRLAEALSFADAATTLLVHLQAQAVNKGDHAAMLHVIEDRAEVHQATGWVAEAMGVSLTQALVMLRARAFATKRPIVDLARDVLSGSTKLDDEDDRKRPGQ